jgi:hypothetical protein
MVGPDELVESAPGPARVTHAPPVENARNTEPAGVVAKDAMVAGKLVTVVALVAVRPMKSNGVSVVADGLSDFDSVERATERRVGSPVGNVVCSVADTDPEPATVTKLRSPGTLFADTVAPEVEIGVLPAGACVAEGDGAETVLLLHAATPNAKSATTVARRV